MGRDNKIIETVSSSEGVRQGDPLSQGLFCVGFTPTYSDLEDKYGVVALGDVDDVIFMGAPDNVMAASEEFEANVAKIGLTTPGKRNKHLFSSAQRF